MDVPFLVWVALTIAANVQLYRFARTYRRVSGDTREYFFDARRTGWLRLLVRRYEVTELKREQAISIAMLMMWLVAAVVAILSFSIPDA